VAETVLNVKIREKTRKSGIHRLRNNKEIPGVIYSKGSPTRLISFTLEDYQKIVKGQGFHRAITIVINGKEDKPEKVIIREIQRDFVKRTVTHVDLLKLEEKNKIRVKIPVHFTGEAYGVKNEGGVLQHVLRTVTVEALPANIPERIEVDVTDVHRSQAIHVRDIKAQGFDIVTPGEQVIGTVKGVRTIEDEEAAAAAAAAAAAPPEEAEAAAEGEAAEAKPGEKGAEAKPDEKGAEAKPGEKAPDKKEAEPKKEAAKGKK
jgi:large subunit ribosomal protein L25